MTVDIDIDPDMDANFRFIPCITCGKKAFWSYMPGDENYCDRCVPRGCSCNLDENGDEDRDEMGRLMPCCEYSSLTEEDHNDPEILKAGIYAYYKYQ